MNYKIKNTFKKSKNVLIVIVVLWVSLSIVLVPSVTVSIVESTENGVFSSGDFIVRLFEIMSDIGDNLGKIFTGKYFKTLLKTEGYLIIFLIACAAIGFFKSMPRNEYTDIEHGSSDWAVGEQYEVLSKTKGIILAEKHYLPVDKRGNVNVLVVGRIRFW